MKKAILTHITKEHSKPNVFETGNHPKAESCCANTGKSEM